MRLFTEEQLLDQGFRALVIGEITGGENVERKQYALKRHEIYRDKVKKWVVDSLHREGLKKETVEQMSTRASSISITKKVANKLAQSYVHGVIRKADSPTDQDTLDDLAREMDFDTKMKKVDRFLQVFKNCLQYIKPEVVSRESTPESKKHRIRAQVFSPWQYDVIEDFHDKEMVRAVVLTDFTERNKSTFVAVPEGSDGRNVPNNTYREGDEKDQVIADNPADEGKEHRKFIWWSDSYHFTTNSQGEIIGELSPEDLLNPIKRLPFINYAEDQDGNFWAEGGEDLIDETIVINKQITDVSNIAYHQGWGQPVATGKDLPDKMEVGPDKLLKLDQDSTDDPTPQFFYASSNPPIDSWMRMIEQRVALLLSTNNLSPRNISGSLNAAEFPSGIAMLIENSESTADMQDRQKTFQDNEPLAWEIVRLWQELLRERDALSEDFSNIDTLKSSDVKLEFVGLKQVVTEKEKLEEIKMRKELGINTQIELIMRDNPGISEKDAEKKLMDIQKEKMDRMAQFSRQLGGDNEQVQDEEKPKTGNTEEEDSEEEIGEALG
jgi:hypothetical protein